MRLPGRVAAAIECLPEILEGKQVEAVVRQWSRSHRFAGSKDRSAIRDILYDILRMRQSCAAHGGAETGRALVLGWVRLKGFCVDAVFGADQFGPKPLHEEEILTTAPRAGAHFKNMPEWVFARLKSDHGDLAPKIAKDLSHRAAVDLRVHASRGSREAVQANLSSEGFETVDLPDVYGLRVTSSARQISKSSAYLDGLIELQDANSQAACASILVREDQKVLDYCAGAGGKTLALAAGQPAANFTVWDISETRMVDLLDRAERAGSQVRIAKSDPAMLSDRYDLVLLDVPCSGSGSWRRDPQGKWTLTASRLKDLIETQNRLLQMATGLCAKNGKIAYITCSLFADENDAQIEKFLRENPSWRIEMRKFWYPGQHGDGFFLCILSRHN
ncbi:MAG: RsmB/NOP family class I SAM-dependent RNA methyltransferase [Pseudomonadota bacterium]